MKTWIVVCVAASVAVAIHPQVRGQAQPANPIPQVAIQLSDPETLPIGSSQSPVSGSFNCTDDNSVFLQTITLPKVPTDPASHGDVSLYAVRSPADIIKFGAQSIPGFKAVSPIARYFAGETKVVALAYGLSLDTSFLDKKAEGERVKNLLLTFDRKGSLESFKVLGPDIHPEQVAAYPSGDLLLAARDPIRKSTRLIVTDAEGSPIRELPILQDDPAPDKDFGSLVELEIYPYGQNLLLVPGDTTRPILEVNEAGLVNTYRIHPPKGYGRALALSFSPRSWKFQMESPPGETQSSDRKSAGHDAFGLGALEADGGPVIEFNPADGNPTRLFDLPKSGMQPACEKNDTFLFLSAHAGDGRLMLAKGSALR